LARNIGFTVFKSKWMKHTKKVNYYIVQQIICEYIMYLLCLIENWYNLR